MVCAGHRTPGWPGMGWPDVPQMGHGGAAAWGMSPMPDAPALQDAWERLVANTADSAREGTNSRCVQGPQPSLGLL